MIEEKKNCEEAYTKASYQVTYNTSQIHHTQSLLQKRKIVVISTRIVGVIFYKNILEQ